jgi:2,4-dienoyl-CoA reductase (NADPH2)
MGHSVTLYETADALGGLVRCASRGPYRGELLNLIKYLESEVRRLGVDVRLEREATRDEILGDQPDFVIVATGSHSPPPLIPITRGASVLTVTELLSGNERQLAGKALVVDDGSGGWPACSAAEYLLEAGLQVTLATPASAIGLSVPFESIGRVHARLRSGGVRYLPFTQLAAVDGTSAHLEDVTTATRWEEAVDLVVIHSTFRSEDGLLRELRGAVPVEGIGDCLAPRRITNAVLEANRICRSLDDKELNGTN